MTTERKLPGMANANNSKYNYMLEQNKIIWIIQHCLLMVKR